MTSYQVFNLVATENHSIQVGIPAEEPSEALAVLCLHFITRSEVRAAVIGLIRFLNANEPFPFSYATGITCSTDKQREIEEGLAATALQTANIQSSRWPIAFLPPRTHYFTPQARTFYPVNEKQKPKGLLHRLFGNQR